MEPAKKKLKLSLRKPLKEVQNRFAEPVEEATFTEAAKGVVPENTKQANIWAARTFESWVNHRNKIKPDEPIPSDLLECKDPEVVSRVLRYFVMEVRRSDGECYPPGTIRNLLSGLNRIMKDNGVPFSIFNKEDRRFGELLRTLDTITSSLHRKGVGSVRNAAPVISFEHEDMFWSKGLLGTGTPRSLQHAVFYVLGLNFVLRGVDEQYNMKPEQLVRHPSDPEVYSEDVFYEYTEFVSKNNQHRFKDINSTSKSVKAYAQPGSDRCLVKLLDLYLSKLPPDPPALYMRPLDHKPVDNKKPWFCNARVGINTLKKVVPNLSEDAAINVHYTNHSLRATAVTRMYERGVPEKIIAEKSGHKSLKSLRMYEHTSVDQEKAAGESIVKGSLYRTEEASSSAVSEPEASSSTEKMPEIEKKVSAKKLSESEKLMAQFSGLQNCTFNFYSS